MNNKLESSINIKEIDIGNINEKIFYENVCKILKEIRKEKNLTQEHIARIIGVTSQQYQKYESGINRFSLFYLVKICDYLDVNINELIDTCVNISIKNKNSKTITRNTVINNYYHYGFLNSLITLVKEVTMNINKKLFIGTISIGMFLYWLINLLKFTSYAVGNNIVFLSSQRLILLVMVSILFCNIFPVSILTWITLYATTLALLATLHGTIFHVIAGSTNYYSILASIYIIGFILATIITLYLKHREKRLNNS